MPANNEHVITMTNNALMEPFARGALRLRNRVVMAPMTRCRATADHVQRLKNNVALTQPDPGTFYTPGETGYTDYPAVC